MEIQITYDQSPDRLLRIIEKTLDLTRFTAELSLETTKKKHAVIKLRKVRLKKSKHYCGNHPLACDVVRGRKGTFLEGIDWVCFNDLINTICDHYNVSAIIKTSVCLIRDGRARRIEYRADPKWQGRIPQWEYHGKMDRHLYDPNRLWLKSKHPEGPGIYQVWEGEEVHDKDWHEYVTFA